MFLLKKINLLRVLPLSISSSKEPPYVRQAKLLTTNSDKMEFHVLRMSVCFPQGWPQVYEVLSRHFFELNYLRMWDGFNQILLQNLNYNYTLKGDTYCQIQVLLLISFVI